MRIVQVACTECARMKKAVEEMHLTVSMVSEEWAVIVEERDELAARLLLAGAERIER